jgi:hypothetical protein
VFHEEDAGAAVYSLWMEQNKGMVASTSDAAIKLVRIAGKCSRTRLSVPSMWCAMLLQELLLDYTYGGLTHSIRLSS